ncbi:lasso peptide biosynthesis B2 protein [Escherichia coli]|nr:lasso peptide biosynthesis B2 protein [Escherichia coli]EEV0645720.1 lasso peptide biosynthesis B2 protein [Escherichia coli]EFB7170056.1 lasso peptide biosynthesis B2 protein [Escherichia coli]EFG1979355.1 lasso peptide biosynthesis B2 protein [Escherichia coli]EFG9355634.1 lasso peptide biosynthesis B2 protein [Escherichia coli]
MTSFYFKPNIHHVNINNEITILDEISDRYILLSEKQSILLKEYMSDGSHNYVGDTMNLEGIISKESGTPLAKSTPSPQGVGILTWNSYVSTRLGIASFFYIAEAIMRMILVRKRLQSKGFHHCLEHCRCALSQKSFPYISLKDKLIIGQKLSQSIKIAAPFIPGKVKCLEFSLVLFDMLVSRKISPTLFIEFQRYDFLSHAWLEIDNEVVADQDNLKTKLTPIIRVG